MLDVCVLGCGGVVPKSDRHLASAYLRYNGFGVLIDCGEGTQLAVKKAGFLLSRIGLILITHFHADHTSGLPGLLLSMGNEGRTEPVTIAGPEGIEHIVRSLCVIAPEIPFDIDFVPLGDFDSVERGGVSVTAFELLHSCPCFGYDIRISRGGKFDKTKAEANGVPMKYWKTLQLGEAVDGFTPDMVLGESRRGIHVTYATDSRPLEIIATMADGADLLICEGMFETAKLDRAKEARHMTIREAASLAAEAQPEELWLTHYSPSMPDPTEFVSEAAYFPTTVFAADGTTKTIKFK
ncbi:MAG: ribonuclease Z [Ruminococcaceae bacterium]|nr:ribonuclease Z [Oscillospiraceae bacterium]